MITNKYNIGDRVKFTYSWDKDVIYEGTIIGINKKRTYRHLLYNLTNCYSPRKLEGMSAKYIQEIDIISKIEESKDEMD